MLDKPKFKDAFMLTISFKPLTVRWALLLKSFTAFLNNIKSAAFLVNNGYFSIWIISLFKSSLESI